MNTRHKIHFGLSQNMDKIGNDTIDLVVTSPPYPMIEMWDEIMSLQNPEIGKAIKENNGDLAFELMHKELDKVWSEVNRVTKPGGWACINIGDATRTLDGEFKLYPNHSRIIQYFLSVGFSNMPNIIWRKQTNAPNKFMGSGMLPAGAYVTLEHEWVLIFRKGLKRTFKSDDEKLSRKQSSFFWEERNIWFSDMWDLKGTRQNIDNKNSRERSAAYPFEVPFRLINMFSLKGDTILDPVLGTGTTTLAAMATGRNSIGYDVDENITHPLNEELKNKDLVDTLNRANITRISNHIEFVKNRKVDKGQDTFIHRNENYAFEVMTNQETEILINFVKDIKVKDEEISVGYFDKPMTDVFSTNSLFALK